MITDIAKNRELEYRSNIDRFSHSVIIAQLELLLTYADRFYQRRFITRKVSGHEIVTRFEQLLNMYFSSGALTEQGLLAVLYFRCPRGVKLELFDGGFGEFGVNFEAIGCIMEGEEVRRKCWG